MPSVLHLMSSSCIEGKIEGLANVLHTVSLSEVEVGSGRPFDDMDGLAERKLQGVSCRAETSAFLR